MRRHERTNEAVPRPSGSETNPTYWRCEGALVSLVDVVACAPRVMMAIVKNSWPDIWVCNL